MSRSVYSASLDGPNVGRTPGPLAATAAKSLTTADTEVLHYPMAKEHIPDLKLSEGRYTLRFACNQEELNAAMRLRFEVFNLEMGEGLSSSFRTGRDQDQFDFVCHHLIVQENSTGEIVGTYRVQTSEMAGRWCGFYSAGEFDLSGIPSHVLNQSVELGRACIARPHRNTKVLFLLWKGLAAYVAHNHKRYLFGCCSLTSQNPVEGLEAMDYLMREGHVHPSYSATAQVGFEVPNSGVSFERKADLELPPLFRIYLRYAAKVCSPPVIDPEFKTIDFLVLLDIDDLDDRSRRMFFNVR